MNKKEWIVLSIAALAPVLILGPGLTGIAFLPGSDYSDFLITHYPNIIVIQNSLKIFHVLPLWSDHIFSGYPFYADPLSSMFYPPMWIAWILPAPMGINLIVLLHVIIGGVGVYFLARKSGCSFTAGVIAMGTFSLMPKMYAHLGAGHITLVMATCLIPWMLVSIFPVQEGRGCRIVYSGLFLGLIMLADPRVYPFAAMLFVCFYVIAHSLTPKEKLLLISKQIIISVMVSAPLVIPLMRLSSLSNRSNLTMQEQAIFSLPPARLFGWIFPDLGGNPELMTYFGAFGVVTLLLSLIIRPINKNVVWLVILIFSILYALGANFLIFPIFARIPVFNLLRVPTRLLLIGGLALSMMSGIIFDSLRDYLRKKNSILVLISLWLFVTVFSVGIIIVLDDMPLEIFIGWLLLSMVTLLLVLWEKIKWGKWIMVLVIFLNLGVVNMSLIEFRPISDIRMETPIQKLQAEEGTQTRIYSPSDSVPQHYAAYHQISMANGINPIQLANYASFMTEATGVPRISYSVSIPPYASGNPKEDNRFYTPNMELMGRLGVKYIVANFELAMEAAELIKSDGNIYFYQNLKARPKGWLQKSDDLIDNNYINVEEYSRRQNEILITAAGPSQLVIADVNYPGWVCSIDENRTMINPIDIFISLKLSPGRHTVECKFVPIDYLVGILLAVCAIVIMIKPILWK